MLEEEKKTEEASSEEEISEEKEDSPKVEMKKAYKKELAKKDEEIEELKKQREYYKNEYYKAYADMQNLRKALEKDHSEAMRYRAEGFIEKLLPVLDGFYMALANEPDDVALKNYLIGFKYIYNSFLSAIESEGATSLVPKVGDKFDPNTMNALEVEETDGEENLITKVCQTGVKLHDRIIRPVSVIVSKHKTEDKNEDKTDGDKPLDA